MYAALENLKILIIIRRQIQIKYKYDVSSSAKSGGCGVTGM